VFDVFTPPGGLFKRGEIQGPGDFTVESVDAGDDGSVVVRGVKNGFAGQSAAVPIDEVEAVWRQNNGRWAVRVSGRLELFSELHGPAVDELSYVPPTTFVVSPVARPSKDSPNASMA